MNFENARAQMVEQQVRAWEVLNDRVLDVLRTLPREAFVPQRYEKLAFADTSIPLPHGQCMMTPKMEGRLLQALELRPDDSILEIGTGSGFLAGCLARLGGNVVSADIYPDFTEQAAPRLKKLGIQNVTLECWDATQMDMQNRFDAIAVTGSIPEYETRFERALRVGGRLFIIVGEEPVMEALLVTRLTETEWNRDIRFETVLTPLVNARKSEKFVF